MNQTQDLQEQIKAMPDYMLQTRLNGQTSNENNDATLIAIVSIFLSVSTFILAGSFIKYLILVAVFMLSIQFILSSINIYRRFHPKYAVGDSYIARKTFTAAVPYFIYSLIIPYIIYEHSIFWIGLFFLPFLFVSPIINSLWRSFDNVKYAEIDLANPIQRRSFFETAKQAEIYYLCRKELALREFNRYNHVSKNIEDIEIRRKD